MRGTDNRHVLDLSGKANQCPLPLQLAQAYSILYYAKGTPLYEEIHTLYDKYGAGDEATVAKLCPLLGKPTTSTASPSPENDTATPQTDVTTTQTDTTTAQADTSTSQTNAVPPTSKGTRTKKSQPKGRKQAKEKKQSKPNNNIPRFVVFQQAIIREKIKEMSNAEAAAVEELIEDRYAVAMEIWESPWLAPVKGQEQLSATELENKFFQG